MKSRILAVCDSEEAYADRLMEYLNVKQVSPFYVRAFTSIGALEDFAKQEEIEVVLLSAEFWEELADRDMQNLHIGKKILLTQGQMPQELKGEPAIYKYQSAEAIIREILFLYAEEAQPFLQAALLKKEVELYGVYSPVHRIGKTAFALALGSVCAEKKRTLYLNLEPWSGFEELLGSVKYSHQGREACKGGRWNLGDLLYYLKKGKQGFLYKLKSVTESFGALDYILPVLSPEDLLTVSEEEWEELLERFISDAEYECVVIDFSDCIQGLPALLEKCRRVYLPTREDDLSQARIRQFKNVLEMRKCESLRITIREVRLPECPVWDGANGLEGIPGELYSFAKEQEVW